MFAPQANEPIVFVVDDDEPSSQAVRELIRSFGQHVEAFHSSREFLERCRRSDPDQVGCLISDLRMPGIDGLELSDHLAELDFSMPMILVTAFADTALTVRAMRRGAVAVLDKPFRDDELWSFVQEAIGKSEDQIARKRRHRDLEGRFRRLASQDRQVLQLILEGSKNRSMAKRLEVSLRTVENRRRRVFDLMRADSVAELARMVVEFEHNLPPTSSRDPGWFDLPFERAS